MNMVLLSKHSSGKKEIKSPWNIMSKDFFFFHISQKASQAFNKIMEQLFRLSKMFLILKHAEDDKKYKKVHVILSICYMSWSNFEAVDHRSSTIFFI